MADRTATPLLDTFEPIKTTASEAVAEALIVLRQAPAPLTIQEYLKVMSGRHVTVPAAQDALEILVDDGSADLTPVGNVRLRTP